MAANPFVNRKIKAKSHSCFGTGMALLFNSRSKNDSTSQFSAVVCPIVARTLNGANALVAYYVVPAPGSYNTKSYHVAYKLCKSLFRTNFCLKK